MKKSIFIILIMVMLIFLSCGEKGLMAIVLVADKTTVQSGGTISFNLELPENEKFVEAKIQVLDGFDVLVETLEVEEQNFSYTFGAADKYSIKVIALSKKDFGSAFMSIEVLSTMNIPDWTLATDGNPSFVKGGSSYTLAFQTLKNTEGISNIDLKMKNLVSGKTYFVEKNIDSVSYTFLTKESDFGNYQIIFCLSNDKGEKGYLFENFTIQNPNNPVMVVLEASKNNSEYPDGIFVSGHVETPNEVVKVELTRTCYYGREAGIYPLSEPRIEGGVDYTKDGEELLTRIETYVFDGGTSTDPFVFNAESKTFSFIDPMNYYDENGDVEETGFKWTYARLDREVWKYIKRNRYKDFNLARVLKVDYEVAITTSVSTTPFKSPVKSGYPYLSTGVMVQICSYFKEVALNRIWQIQAPRFAWDQSLNLMGPLGELSKSATGLRSGEVSFQGGMNGGIKGSGNLVNYSDWENINVNAGKPISLTIELDADQRREHVIQGATIDLGNLYGKIKFSELVGVRDFMYQWGMWIDEDAGTNNDSGVEEGSNPKNDYIRIIRPGQPQEEITFEEMKAILPTYSLKEGRSAGGVQHGMSGGDKVVDRKSYPGYFYDAKDMAPETKVHTWYNTEGNPEGFVPTFTRVNFKYPPTPGHPKLSPWTLHGNSWVEKYGN